MIKSTSGLYYTVALLRIILQEMIYSFFKIKYIYHKLTSFYYFTDVKQSKLSPTP